MHELKVAATLVEFLEKICAEKKPQKVVRLTLKVNPYSCLSQESLSFAFASLAEGKKLFEKARLKIIKNQDPASREIVVDSVEILV
ncbi:MAG TPA: hydrogenase/urease maturation nickel metallochaperone HypA [bacterium]|nr:hydrogenase/urease maturation nickel metallochaperone HypA [bacterium]HOL66815.1 hydrogenase/urease maturation nickel metallochaperone HypA [bacterium]HPP12995.1 hydrogenase/urease maturation nickel metallochaperone HypA [bacterium]